MNLYELPVSLTAGEQELPIRSRGDWRMVIDVNIALTDGTMTEQERLVAALTIFYDCDLEAIRNPQAAAEAMMSFIAAGEEESGPPRPKLVDWEEDAALIVSGVNKVLGSEVRALPYMHWWTFLAAYMAIGDSTLATVVSIRDKLAKGKKLEKYEREFKRDNPHYFMHKRDAEAGHELLLELIEEG